MIGTLLALLVFFALFGIFITQYVPLWMTDNEAQFTSQTATSFAQFKSYVDSQYLIGGPSALGTPFTLSSSNVPLITQSTQGTLSFVPTTCPNGFYVPGAKGETTSNLGQPVSPTYCLFENITLSSGPGGSGVFTQHSQSGLLEMQLPNRYYTQQLFYFENDAVVESQGNGQEILLAVPPFNVTTVASNTTFVSSLLSITGNATAVVGQQTEEVFSHLRYSQVVASKGVISGGVGQPNSLNVTFEIGTPNPCAWQKFLWSEMNVSGIPYSATATAGVSSYNWIVPGTTNESIPVANPVCTSPTGFTTILAVDLHYVDYATIFYAGVQLTFGVGGT